MAKPVRFKMQWVEGKVNIAIERSSDATWYNNQGYRDATDARRAIYALLEGLGAERKVVISGPGKKPT